MMFRNYLKTALRNIARQKGSAIINISGLTLGITCSLVLFLMVNYMSSFDDFHVKRDRIYRVVSTSQGEHGTRYQEGVPTVLPDAFRNDFPQAEQVVFTSYRHEGLVTIPQTTGESKKYQEEGGIVYTEPAFFKVFDRAVLMGDAATGLDAPSEAIVSAGWAKKYFGKEDAIGEVLKFEDHEYKVTAIIEDAPANTDFPFNLMLSYVTIKSESEKGGWGSVWSNEQCYFVVREGENIQSMESRMPAFSDKYLGKDNIYKTQYTYQALSELHYDDRFGTYSESTSPKYMLVAFSVIALVLILTACINFINLATAEAIRRSKEVGVRKTLGSTRSQLVWQFLGETTLITLTAVLASLGCVQLVLGFLNPFLDMKLALDFSHNTQLWTYLISVMVGVSLLSGLYPAFVISGFKPALVLKNQMASKNSSSYILRRALVVLQFFISQLLIIVTIVIIAQMDYSSKKDLGFAKEAILFAPVPEQEKSGATGSKMRALREEMLQVPGVFNASLANNPPSSGNVSSTHFKVDGIDGDFRTELKQVDGNYIDLYELKVVAGKGVQDLDTAREFVVNERLTQVAGFKNAEDILGREITMWGRKNKVAGVVKDFHTVSLRSKIEPTLLMNGLRGYETLALKIDLRQAQPVIDQLKTKWEAAYPEHLFSYEFLDENIREFYEGELKMSVLISSFTSMAIFIGCLGLFGLATFMANQKTKEIGVRKVMGASVESIVFMFSKEYIKLIILGFVFAAPLGWLAVDSFLGEFEYKIEPGVGMFLMSLGITLGIAMLTVGYKSFRAAVRNPVNALRYE